MVNKPKFLYNLSLNKINFAEWTDSNIYFSLGKTTWTINNLQNINFWVIYWFVLWTSVLQVRFSVASHSLLSHSRYIKCFSDNLSYLPTHWYMYFLLYTSQQTQHVLKHIFYIISRTHAMFSICCISFPSLSSTLVLLSSMWKSISHFSSHPCFLKYSSWSLL